LPAFFPKTQVEDWYVPKEKALETVELQGAFDQEAELILKTSLLCNSNLDVESCGRAFCRKFLWDRVDPWWYSQELHYSCSGTCVGYPRKGMVAYSISYLGPAAILGLV